MRLPHHLQIKYLLWVDVVFINYVLFDHHHLREMRGKVEDGGGAQKLVAVAIDKNKASQYALKWAVDNLLDKGQTIFLLHVDTSSRSAPTGKQAQVSNSNGNGIAQTYRLQLAAQNRELFLPFRCFCTLKDIKCNDVVIEDTDVTKAIAEYVSNFAIENLVMGYSCSYPFVKSLPQPILTRLKSSNVPNTVSRLVPDFCSVYMICKEKMSSFRPAVRSPPFVSPLRRRIINQPAPDELQKGRRQVKPGGGFESMKSPLNRNARAATPNAREHGNMNPLDTDISFVSLARPSAGRGFLSLHDHLESAPRPSKASINTDYSSGDNLRHEPSSDVTRRSLDLHVLSRPDPMSNYIDSKRLSTSSLPVDEMESQMRRLRLELKQTMDMYTSACKEALTAKQQAGELHQKRLEEEQKLEVARMAKEAARAAAEQEAPKFKAAMERAEAGSRMAQREARKRQDAESKAQREAEEKIKAMNALVQSDLQYRKYTVDDIEQATNSFSESLKIGEGGYGSVYKCYLDRTLVAIKALRPDAEAQGRLQFHREVEILSCMRHPNMVLLLGACPENGCLVYEYMANGSLDDRLFRRGNTPALSWKTRFRIAAEVGTGLLFLHQTKPEPLVHRDLKPANILLDNNYVSKISDVGLARLVPGNISNSISEYRLTSTAGTFCYIDPEYQQTGRLGIKSDVYSLGIILLQLLTGKQPMGLSHQMEKAIEEGAFENMLDHLVPDWPVQDALSLAKMALKCSELRRKDRPDIATVVLPELKRLRSLAQDDNGQSPIHSHVSPQLDVSSVHSGYESQSSNSSAAESG